MSTRPPTDPQEDDSAVQGAVLHHILDEHPTLLRRSDLLRELPGADRTWAREDTIERAVAELAKRGLLDFLDDLVLPTRPALYCRYLGGV